MKVGRPHVRAELPWLRSGPLFRVHRSAGSDLAAFLTRHGYVRVDLDGRRMTGRAAAHAELARAFGFPDHHGGNWDAFEDCIGDRLHEAVGRPLAVVWADLDDAARLAPATAVEVGWALIEAAMSAPAGTAAFDVFGVGEGEDFDRP